MKSYYNFKSFICFVLAVTLVCPSAKSQSGFFITTDTSSGNIWTGIALGYVTRGVNALFGRNSPVYVYDDSNVHVNLAPGVMGSQFYDDYRIFRENGQLMKLPDRWRSIYGFRAVDLFSQLKANIRVGWMGAFSPIGIYARAGIRHQNFSMMLAQESEASRYMIGTFCPGVGIRLAPGNFFDTDWEVQPFVEFGTNYNKTIYYNGPYDNDKSILNEGLSYMLSGGVQVSKQISAQFGVEWFTYDVFNKDYVVPGSQVCPFSGLSSKMLSFFIGVNRGF